MDLGLSGRVAAITAAGSGIGLAIAQALAAENANVVAADQDVSALAGVPRATALEVDLLTPEGPAALVDAAVATHGRLDILVNCLGGPGAARLGFLERDDETWQHMFELNLLGMVRTSRAALVHLVRSDAGSMVHVASDLARQPDPPFADYGAMKAAVLSVSKSLSIEFGPRVRSNVISPGPTRTPGLLGNFAAEPDTARRGGLEQVLKHYVRDVRRMPSERLGEAHEVAQGAVFLASPAAGQITGAELVVDGGVRKAA